MFVGMAITPIMENTIPRNLLLCNQKANGPKHWYVVFGTEDDPAKFVQGLPFFKARQNRLYTQGHS